MPRFLAWFVAAILVLSPTVYFLMHWSSQSYREGAMGNWFGTVLGVIVGVPIALSIARFQQILQDRAENEKHQRARKEQFRRITQRLWDEIQYNSGEVTELAEMLQKLPIA